ncbi:uncharacterized protein LOC124133930 [Haliotis rufescens]|uniref:uncharacterized protein LOC124133930 n=1 Tax=Haliotis rufescens TaxID=6454 RepID=UPI00201F079A|nr:uncharacterized protein LOC124133930 [Haliotis rufescens]
MLNGTGLSFILWLLMNAASARGDNSPGVSWEVEDMLVKLQDDLGIKSLGSKTPLYRKDMSSDYVAYWLIEFNKEGYVILSSGEATGDYRLLQQGYLPSPVVVLSRRAERQGAPCSRFYVFTIDAEILCEDSQGSVAASTMDELLGNPNELHDEQLAREYRAVSGGQRYLAEEWDKKRRDIRASPEWRTLSVVRAGQGVQQVYEEYVIIAREQAVAVGNATTVRIRAFNETATFDPFILVPKYESKQTSDLQQNTCILTQLCSSSDLTLINQEKIKTDENGLRYVPVRFGITRIPVRFQIEVYLSDGSVAVRNFRLDVSLTRAAVQPMHIYTVPLEEEFPDYWQPTVNASLNRQYQQCQVGDGTVAWAMVLGYYDRRSSARPREFGTASQGLFRCGPFGFHGDKKCKAPKKNDASFEKYLDSLKRRLNVICNGDVGVTRDTMMANIQPLFDHLMEEASTVVLTHQSDKKLYGLLPNYFPRDPDGARNHAIKHLMSRDTLPVVVDSRMSRFWGPVGQHYVVATKLRRRSLRYRVCTGRGCGQWRTDFDVEWYEHSGLESKVGDGWQKANTFFAAIASYK